MLAFTLAFINPVGLCCNYMHSILRDFVETLALPNGPMSYSSLRYGLKTRLDYVSPLHSFHPFVLFLCFRFHLTPFSWSVLMERKKKVFGSFDGIENHPPFSLTHIEVRITKGCKFQVFLCIERVGRREIVEKFLEIKIVMKQRSFEILIELNSQTRILE